MTVRDREANRLPPNLGPYEVLRRLGAGGMGEVFEAKDDRLGRRVAIKRLSDGAAADAVGRRRLRQEARTAAQLNHPSLVQIYDILELPEGDFLVLELVEGATLQERLVSGPLTADELLRLGRQLTAGLRHIHERGIVHRDLKPGNVLMTRGGQAKIADFGIAKGPARDGEDLTRGKPLVGTYRNMSPEQAQGLVLDRRSDLFSLGLLLYEAATGSNPFRDDDPLGTLRRIVHDDEPPLGPRRPDLPASFTGLVHHLMAKSPELRPQSAGEVLRELAGVESPGTDGETQTGGTSHDGCDDPADRSSGPSPAEGLPSGRAVFGSGRRRRGRSAPWLRTPVVLASSLLVLALAAGILALRAPAGRTSSIAIAVPQPLGDGDAAGATAPRAVHFALVSALLELEGTSILAASEVDAAGTRPPDVARVTGADEILASELSCRRQHCWITLSRIAAPDQEILWTERLEAPEDDLHLLSQVVMGAVREGYAELDSRRTGGETLEVRPDDYEEFLRIHTAFADRSQGESMDDVLEGLAAIRRTSPRFLNAYLLAAEALRMEFVTGRREEDLHRAFELLEQARDLAPEHPLPLNYQVNLALAGSRLDEARDALEELSRRAPGWIQLGSLRAHLLEAEGSDREALEELRRVARRRPSRTNLSNLANMEFRLGDVEASRRSLHEALTLSPDDYTLRTQLALVELMGGSAERAAELYADLVAESPGFSELSNLGLAFLLLERYEEARQQFQAALDLAPGNVFAILNLADAHGLVGDHARAQDLYRRLLVTLEQDPAAEGWQFSTVEAQALARLGRFKEAVAAVSEAQRLAPGSSQVAYESALVYALAGDETSAAVQAERALALGYDSRWFSFPWFDGVFDGSP